MGSLWMGSAWFTSDTPPWMYPLTWWGSIVLNMGISVTLFFFLGKKLNLLDKHWLNYLSVSGSLVLPMSSGLGFSGSSWLFSVIFPFGMLLEIVRPGGSESYPPILICIIAILPSIIIWLGMLYKSRKI